MYVARSRDAKHDVLNRSLIIKNTVLLIQWIGSNSPEIRIMPRQQIAGPLGPVQLPMHIADASPLLMFATLRSAFLLASHAMARHVRDGTIRGGLTGEAQAAGPFGQGCPAVQSIVDDTWYAESDGARKAGREKKKRDVEEGCIAQRVNLEHD